MSTPVTARFDPEVVDALDRAVEAGIGPTRAAIIVAAVREWLRTHGEDAITDSYRRRYAESDADHDRLVAELASFSVAACLAVSER
jgi:Arc/MetJ-type ribon-helix-helix transcriptional regulator